MCTHWETKVPQGSSEGSSCRLWGRKWRHSQGEAGLRTYTRGALAPPPWPYVPSQSAHGGVYCCYVCASHWQFFMARCRAYCAHAVQLCLMAPKQGAGTVSGLLGPPAVTPSQAMFQPSTQPAWPWASGFCLQVSCMLPEQNPVPTSPSCRGTGGVIISRRAYLMVSLE